MSIYTYETKKDTRSGFGAGMEYLSLNNPKVVANNNSKQFTIKKLALFS